MPWIIPPGAVVDSEFRIGVGCPHAQATAIARDNPSRNHRQVSDLISTIDGIINRSQPAGRGRARNKITSTPVLMAL
jgi:hypothetical protein